MAHSARPYVLVLVALLVLTGVTVGVAYVPLGGLAAVAAMAIASLKAFLVGAVFMHLRGASGFTRLVAVSGVAWLVLLVALVLADVATRVHPLPLEEPVPIGAGARSQGQSHSPAGSDPAR